MIGVKIGEFLYESDSLFQIFILRGCCFGCRGAKSLDRSRIIAFDENVNGSTADILMTGIRYAIGPKIGIGFGKSDAWFKKLERSCVSEWTCGVPGQDAGLLHGAL
ncbi:hypothetical protein ATN84_10325 [Paramesorhizobium deserti]|uniref:Uncharacterized protein n=1 Tax=Paramesorhizobium deserti TaxID=1494590 RepID=A0A135HX05_9HYPH|nr:hypothetical protein [Paramesorhizobium deserti]KXF77720.1 hypothetical protein ATN84_10325 [Paramesorhizobium deserti]